MSVTVEIKQKGVLKKELKLTDLLQPGMRYGIMDEEYRLIEGEQGKSTILYFPEHIHRGYEINIAGDNIELRLMLPTSKTEIIGFYDYVKYLCERLKTHSFIREGENVDIRDIESFIELDTNTGVRTLEYIEQQLEADYKSFYIFGVMNPIALGKTAFERFGNDIEEFGQYLHELQSMDAYYAKSLICRNNSKDCLFGVIPVSADVRYILPYTPGLIANQEMVINDWYAHVIIQGGESAPVKYSDFLSNVDTSEEYDAEHFILVLSEDNANILMNEYKTDEV